MSKEKIKQESVADKLLRSIKETKMAVSEVGKAIRETRYEGKKLIEALFEAMPGLLQKRQTLLLKKPLVALIKDRLTHKEVSVHTA